MCKTNTNSLWAQPAQTSAKSRPWKKFSNKGREFFMKVCQKGCVIPQFKLPFISFGALHNLAVKHKNPFTSVRITKLNLHQKTSELWRIKSSHWKVLKMATFSSLVFRRLMRTTSLDKSSLQLQSKRITDNLSYIVRIEQNGSKQFKVGLKPNYFKKQHSSSSLLLT